MKPMRVPPVRGRACPALDTGAPADRSSSGGWRSLAFGDRGLRRLTEGAGAFEAPESISNSDWL